MRPSGSSSVAGDETVSMVSDTWSTDVLASDTETLPGEAEGGMQHGAAMGGGGRPSQLEDLGWDSVLLF